MWNHTETRQARGYGVEWQKLRLVILARDHYLCQPCIKKGRTTPANEVDHKINKAQDGTDDCGNLQSICTECHKTKTLREQGKERKPAYGVDGMPITDHEWTD